MSRRRHEALRREVATYREVASAEIICLRAELRRLREAVALHRPDEAEVGWQLCHECAAPWPCSTVRAAGLDGEERQ